MVLELFLEMDGLPQSRPPRPLRLQLVSPAASLRTPCAQPSERVNGEAQCGRSARPARSSSIITVHAALHQAWAPWRGGAARFEVSSTRSTGAAAVMPRQFLKREAQPEASART